MSASRIRWQNFRGTLSLRTAVLALCLGNPVQWYDLALYGALPQSSDRCSSPLRTLPWSCWPPSRPVGALLFGRMADLRGRRAVFVPVILLMAGATAAVGFLPGYATIGILAPITLIMLRAVWQPVRPGSDQILVTTLNLDIAAGLYVVWPTAWH